jgi:HAD superfamily phosphatase
MSKPILVFDMDGVLVDVTASYRETIARTVEHFTGASIAPERIQEYKNEGGWNDDWKLSHHIVNSAQENVPAGIRPVPSGRDNAALGFVSAPPGRNNASLQTTPPAGRNNVPFEEVKAYFQKLFLGDGSDGLMRREQWVARPGVLERLNQGFQFALFTGRPKAEARMTLDRFAPGIEFAPIVGMYEVRNQKPAPDGLLQIREASPGCDLYYVGDSVDDAQCAQSAGVPFIGVAAPSNPLYLDLVFLFQAAGAYAIVDDINFLEEVFAP